MSRGGGETAKFMEAPISRFLKEKSFCSPTAVSGMGMIAVIQSQKTTAIIGKRKFGEIANATEWLQKFYPKKAGLFFVYGSVKSPKKVCRLVY